VTTKKVVREVVYKSSGVEMTSTLERKFEYNQEQHGSLSDFQEAVENMAVQSISDIFDRKTVVLTDSNGNFFAIKGENIRAASSRVVDTLKV